MTRRRTWVEVAAITVDELLAGPGLSAAVRHELGVLALALDGHTKEGSGTTCHFVLRGDGKEELLLETRVGAVPRQNDVVTLPGAEGRESERDTFVVTDVEWVPHMQLAVVYFDTYPDGNTSAREKVDLDGSRHVAKLVRGGKAN